MHKNSVMLIIDILSAAQSTYVRQLLILRDEIESGIVEAKSNIEFLSILKDVYAELIECTDTTSIAKCLPKIMHLFRTIWLNAPYYSTHGRITILFSALSNQIVVMCKDFIDLDDIFAGRTRKSMAILNKCIKLCEDYRSLYDDVSCISSFT
jgi:dynein heavy chain